MDIGIYLFLFTDYIVNLSSRAQIFFNFVSFRSSATQSVGPQIVCDLSETRTV